MSASSYKHDCGCFDYINSHTLISGITGIVQEYLHSTCAEYIRTVLKPPISLRYSSAEDYHFILGQKEMSGIVPRLYASNVYAAIELDIIRSSRAQKKSPSWCTIEISITFSKTICISMQCQPLVGKKLLLRTTFSGNAIGEAINTILMQDRRDEMIAIIINCNSSIHEKYIPLLISSELFNNACNMFRRRIVREIYSKYHVDQQVEADLENHYEIPNI